ncbi:hypothetical protein VTN00DRAFT_2821 [Thermoascus crustaceus]|uniref:uncharacterized protein n=1 Tax=Thermoascus crustaceus TaxID=5088 RepID=UPI0037426BA3
MVERKTSQSGPCELEKDTSRAGDLPLDESTGWRSDDAADKMRITSGASSPSESSTAQRSGEDMESAWGSFQPGAHFSLKVSRRTRVPRGFARASNVMGWSWRRWRHRALRVWPGLAGSFRGA